MFGISGIELVVIFIVALIIFGPKKLPELSRSIARGYAEFKKAQYEITRTINREVYMMEEQEQQQAADKAPPIDTTATQPDPYSSESSPAPKQDKPTDE